MLQGPRGIDIGRRQFFSRIGNAIKPALAQTPLKTSLVKPLEKGFLISRMMFMKIAGLFTVSLGVGCGSVTETPDTGWTDNALARDMFNAGMEHYDDSEYAEAIEDFEKLLNIYPDSPFVERALFSLSGCYRALEDYEMVISACNEFLSSFPGSANAVYAHADLAEAYTYLGRNTEAIAEYNTIIQNYPDWELMDQAYYRLGFLYLDVLNYGMAIQTFETLLRKFPDSPFNSWGTYYLGNAYEGSKEYFKAVDAYRLVIANFPETTPAIEAQKRLDALCLRGYCY